MGAYWDAMEAEEKRNGTEAYEAFLKITKALQEGNPGIGTFDDFSLYDGWVSLCKDYEIYWNEHVSEIYALSFTYKKDALDMKTRTATYDFGVIQRTTPKFEYIYAAVKGLDKSRRKDWVEIPGMWPTVSIFKDSSTIPVVTYTWDYSKDKRDPYEVYYGEEVELKKPSIFEIHSFQKYTPQGKISTVTMPAWSVLNRAVLEEGKNLYGGNFSCIEWESAIKIQFHIDDENGRIIGKMDKASYMYPDIKKYGDTGSYVSCYQKISGIAASDVKIMDEGKFSIIIDTFTLNPNSTQTEYNQNGKKLIDSETKAKITAELPTFNLKPSSKTKAYKVMDDFSSRQKLAKIFNESYTPNDVAIETAVMTTFRNKGFIGIVDDSEQFCILTEELELQGMWGANNKNIYKIPLPIEEKCFRDCVDFIKILGKIEGTEFKEGWCKQNHREISDYTERCFYRLLTESEKKALAEKQAAEAKAKADAEAKKIADMHAKISPEPKDYASILVEATVASGRIQVANYEVTQYLFEKLMGYNPSKRQNPLYPVTNISFYEIMAFCNRLSIAAGLTPVYTINKSTNPDDWGTVPTEKDKKWEKYSMNKKTNGYCLAESSLRGEISSIRDVLHNTTGFNDLYSNLPNYYELYYDAEYKRVDGCENLWKKARDFKFRVEKKN